MKGELVVVSFTEMSSDVRILRHLEVLSREFRLKTISYGPAPTVSERHLEIPASDAYLPLNLRGLSSLLTRQFSCAASLTPAVNFVGNHLLEISPTSVVLNDVQTLPLIDYLSPDTVVIADMHEYAPLEMADDWRFKLLLQRYYTKLCDKYLKKAQLVVTVSSGLATRFRHEFGVDVDVVLNARDYVPLETLEKSPSKGPIRLVHTGLAAKSRHLELMIEAVGPLADVSLDLYLKPAPRQKRTLKRIQRICRQYDNCLVHSPVPQTEIPRLISSYDAGFLIISPSNFSLEHCMPNKLFDCIQARRPVVVGPSPDMAKFVRDHGIGVITGSFDVKDIRKTLSTLSRDSLGELRPNVEVIAKQVTGLTEGTRFSNLIRMAIDRAAHDPRSTS